MPDDPKKTTRLGIFPVGLGLLGAVVMFVVAFSMTKLFDLARWFMQWLEK
jgi:hypothetical protein